MTVYQESSVEDRPKLAENVPIKLRQREQWVTQFAAAVWEPSDVVEVRRLPSKRSTWHRSSELAAAVMQFAEDNALGENIYVGVNPRKRKWARGDDGVALARCVFVDFDDGVTLIRARAIIEAAGLLPPTIMVASGHGVHCYWLLRVPATDLGQWTRWQKHLIGVLGSDPVIHNPERIMRLPGFINHKPPPAPCSLMDCASDRVYTLDDLGISAEQCRDTHRREPAISSVIVSNSFSASSVPASVSRLYSSELVQQAISATLPREPGQRHYCVFGLCRRLRGIPELAQAKPEWLRPIVHQWFGRALPIIGSSDGKTFAPTWFDFLSGWGRVRRPHGAVVKLETIMDHVNTDDLPAVFADYDEDVRRLGGLCRELQRQNRDQPFFLACRTARKLLGLKTHTEVAKWLRMLAADGVLAIVEPGTKKKATRYRYVSSAGPCQNDNPKESHNDQ